MAHARFEVLLAGCVAPVESAMAAGAANQIGGRVPGEEHVLLWSRPHGGSEHAA